LSLASRNLISLMPAMVAEKIRRYHGARRQARAVGMSLMII
jgi:hypothetical protein